MKNQHCVFNVAFHFLLGEVCNTNKSLSLSPAEAKMIYVNCETKYLPSSPIRPLLRMLISLHAWNCHNSATPPNSLSALMGVSRALLSILTLHPFNVSESIHYYSLSAHPLYIWRFWDNKPPTLFLLSSHLLLYFLSLWQHRAAYHFSFYRMRAPPWWSKS